MPSTKRIIIAVVISLGLAASIASGSSNQASKVGGGSDGGSTGTPQVFKVGDLVKLGDWEVKVWGVQDPFTSTNQFEQPSAGERHVAIDAEVTNNSKTAETVSSLACFEIQDSLNKSYGSGIVSGAPNPPDGDVAPGASRRGTLVYDVPTTAVGLKLMFKCDLFSTGSAVIALS
jgi:hypothetical protein